ncbi:hypothetical protein EW026_g2281 [Hermanssonia centrifuga]|uniref:Uncharacterized protein n=1 Tax=Hermanssonia centrifuga TaxID=98765 RepID=A0A4S4KPR5_9APHY|nr:hypothetical protein EW026_g2281 [Hermanssonia centrifuga]
MDPSTYNSELSLAYAGAAAGALVFYDMIIATLLAMTWLKTYGIYKATRRTGMTPTLTILLLPDGTFCYMFEPGRNPSLLTVYKM